MKKLLLLVFIIPVIGFAQIKSQIRGSSSSVEKLLGNWFVPHYAITNIKFYRNKKFVFNDHNSTLDKDEKLTGTFILKGPVLTLLYDDRPQQKFKFYKGVGTDNNYYIESMGKGGYYFVKGENGN
ncbi:MAG TPA: hypothetical protein VGP43_04490 [Chitinophagaceae bacterium]|nr:hypothetical protein [Chitinophagaceae bacterium]